MAHRNASRFRSTNAMRRKTAWGLGPRDTDGGFSATGKALWSSAVVPDENGLTIVRIRGIFSITQATAGVALDGFFGAVGFCIITDEALAIGITAVPDPLSDEGNDIWMWHSYFDTRSATATFADGVNAGGIFARIDIDNKAMRRFDPGKAIVGVTSVIESGTATCEIQASSRILFKLP